MENELDLLLSEAARAQLVLFRSLIEKDYFVSLVQEGIPGSPNARWGVGSYAPERIEPFRAQFSEAGIPFSYRLAGMEVIIESHFAKLLRGKSLDFANGNFFVRERTHDSQ